MSDERPDPEPTDPGAADASSIGLGGKTTLRTHFLNQLLRLFVKRRLRSVSLDLASIEKARAQIEDYAARQSRRDRSGGCDIFAGQLGGRPAETITPAPARQVDRPVVLFLHGGAFVFCSPRTHRPITTYLARAAGARVVAPEYRLAPEHPFPAALDDAVAAFRQLLDTGTPCTSIVLAGDSAGGGLVLAVLHALRALGLPMPAGAACFSPWTDLTCSGASLRGNEKTEAMLPPERIADAASLYANGRDPADSLVSPLFGSFAGFPPLLLHAGSGEVLLDDTSRVASLAREAGVDVQCRIWQGQPHVFHIFAPHLPEASLALDEAGRFIRRVTGQD